MRLIVSVVLLRVGAVMTAAGWRWCVRGLSRDQRLRILSDRSACLVVMDHRGRMRVVAEIAATTQGGTVAAAAVGVGGSG